MVFSGDLKEHVTRMSLPSTNEAATLALKPRGDVTRSPKTVVSVAPQEGLMSSKNLKTKQNMVFWKKNMWVTSGWQIVNNEIVSKQKTRNVLSMPRIISSRVLLSICAIQVAREIFKTKQLWQKLPAFLLVIFKGLSALHLAISCANT